MALIENLAEFFADFGSTVEVGDLVVQGILDAPGSTLNIGGLAVEAAEYSLLVPTSVGLRRNSQIKVDGVAFQVRDVDAEDDGKISRAKLKRI